MRFRVDLKIIFFLALFYFTKQLYLYILVMLFAFIHECAHMLSALFLGFKIQYIELMPFGFFTSLEANIDDYNKKIGKSNLVEFKKIFVILAGPLSNLAIILVLGILSKYYWINKLDIMIYCNVLLFFINMLPIFPLDGGRMCKSILKICLGPKNTYILVHYISYITGIIITIISSIMILYFKNIAILLIVIYIWSLIHIENKKIIPFYYNDIFH